MHMDFASLVSPLPVPEALGAWRPSGLENDSRRVGKDQLFLAYPGSTADGRQYITEAFRRGATAALVEPGGDWPGQVAAAEGPLVEYPGLKDDLGKLSGRFYNWPDRHLAAAAVTGTAGKSTSAWLAAELLHRAGSPCGYIGSLGAGMAGAGELESLPNTTPDVLCSRRLLSRMLDHSASAVAMEASSEGLAENRLADLCVRVAAFTNLGSDHLEVHGGRDGLERAKRTLFEMDSLESVIFNLDDPFGAALASLVRRTRPDLNVFGYGTGPEADFHLDIDGANACQIRFGNRSVSAELPGRHNAYNLACALAMAHCLGVDFARLAEVASRPLLLPPGRLQKIFADPDCYLDYAHSPEALEAILLALRPLCTGNLWCVFGCGGERDRGKRPRMGAIASKLADKVVITQDNPRGEDPNQIESDILAGAREQGRILVESDRRRAIFAALQQAAPEDLVVIAGKGHEQTQQIGAESVAFSDLEVALDWRSRAQ